MCLSTLDLCMMVEYLADSACSPVEALRNLDYITACAQRGELDDPFLVTTKKTLHRRLIEEIEADYRSRGDDPFRSGLRTEDFERFRKDMAMLHGGALATPLDDRNVLRFGSTRGLRNRQAALKGYLERLVMAVMGGAFLVAPMLIMVLAPSLVTSLVTTCVFVFAFSLVISFFLEKAFDVLSATAAYAAVLVVFVGTSIGSAAAPVTPSG